MRYRLFLPDGRSVVRFCYRTSSRDASTLVGHASTLESLTRQALLTPELAVPFQHWGLLRDADLDVLFPSRRGPLTYDPDALMAEYADYCATHCTSEKTVSENTRRARVTTRDITQWQSARIKVAASGTVNNELSVLHQLQIICADMGWRTDVPTRGVRKLRGKASRFPRALTFVEVQRLLSVLADPPAGAKAFWSVAYRFAVAGIFFGLRRGELLHLMGTDTDGRQLMIQDKTLHDGRVWRPKDRDKRAIRYPGVERPLLIVFGETPTAGLLFSPRADHSRPFKPDFPSKFMTRVLRPIAPGVTLHGLRHTFATWRLMVGDPLLSVKGMMGHSDANTLLKYAHIQPDPMGDLLPLLR